MKISPHTLHTRVSRLRRFAPFEKIRKRLFCSLCVMLSEQQNPPLNSLNSALFHVTTEQVHAKKALINATTLFDETPGGGGVLPYLGYTGTCRWIGFFGLADLNRVCNLTCLCPKQVKACPKQGMVLQAERLQPRLRGVSFFSWLATRA